MGLSGIIWDYLEIYLTIWEYLGASKSRREQVIAMGNFFLIPFFFFFTRAIPRGARAPKKSKNEFVNSQDVLRLKVVSEK